MNMNSCEATAQALKIMMEYCENTCEKCTHYREADCSGAATAEGERCRLNPAVDVPVSGSKGRCRFFSHKDRLTVKRPD